MRNQYYGTVESGLLTLRYETMLHLILDNSDMEDLFAR